MKFTKRQRQILEHLEQQDDDPECDLVESDGEVWFGDERTNMHTLLFFLKHIVVQPMQDFVQNTRYIKYEITPEGSRALREEAYDPLCEMLTLMGQQRRKRRKK